MTAPRHTRWSDDPSKKKDQMPAASMTMVRVVPGPVLGAANNDISEIGEDGGGPTGSRALGWGLVRSPAVPGGLSRWCNERPMRPSGDDRRGTTRGPTNGAGRRPGGGTRHPDCDVARVRWLVGSTAEHARSERARRFQRLLRVGQGGAQGRPRVLRSGRGREAHCGGGRHHRTQSRRPLQHLDRGDVQQQWCRRRSGRRGQGDPGDGRPLVRRPGQRRRPGPAPGRRPPGPRDTAGGRGAPGPAARSRRAGRRLGRRGRRRRRCRVCRRARSRGYRPKVRDRGRHGGRHEPPHPSDRPFARRDGGEVLLEGDRFGEGSIVADLSCQPTDPASGTAMLDEVGDALLTAGQFSARPPWIGPPPTPREALARATIAGTSRERPPRWATNTYQELARRIADAPEEDHTAAIAEFGDYVRKRGVELMNGEVDPEVLALILDTQALSDSASPPGVGTDTRSADGPAPGRVRVGRRAAGARRLRPPPDLRDDAPAGWPARDGLAELRAPGGGCLRPSPATSRPRAVRTSASGSWTSTRCAALTSVSPPWPQRGPDLGGESLRRQRHRVGQVSAIRRAGPTESDMTTSLRHGGRGRRALPAERS